MAPTPQLEMVRLSSGLNLSFIASCGDDDRKVLMYLIPDLTKANTIICMTCKKEVLVHDCASDAVSKKQYDHYRNTNHNPRYYLQISEYKPMIEKILPRGTRTDPKRTTFALSLDDVPLLNNFLSKYDLSLSAVNLPVIAVRPTRMKRYCKACFRIQTTESRCDCSNDTMSVVQVASLDGSTMPLVVLDPQKKEDGNVLAYAKHTYMTSSRPLLFGHITIETEEKEPIRRSIVAQRISHPSHVNSEEIPPVAFRADLNKVWGNVDLNDGLASGTQNRRNEIHRANESNSTDEMEYLFNGRCNLSPEQKQKLADATDVAGRKHEGIVKYIEQLVAEYVTCVYELVDQEDFFVLNIVSQLPAIVANRFGYDVQGARDGDRRVMNASEFSGKAADSIARTLKEFVLATISLSLPGCETAWHALKCIELATLAMDEQKQGFHRQARNFLHESIIRFAKTSVSTDVRIVMRLFLYEVSKPTKNLLSSSADEDDASDDEEEEFGMEQTVSENGGGTRTVSVRSRSAFRARLQAMLKIIKLAAYVSYRAIRHEMGIEFFGWFAENAIAYPMLAQSIGFLTKIMESDPNTPSQNHWYECEYQFDEVFAYENRGIRFTGKQMIDALIACEREVELRIRDCHLGKERSTEDEELLAQSFQRLVIVSNEHGVEPRLDTKIEGFKQLRAKAEAISKQDPKLFEGMVQECFEELIGAIFLQGSATLRPRDFQHFTRGSVYNGEAKQGTIFLYQLNGAQHVALRWTTDKTKKDDMTILPRQLSLAFLVYLDILRPLVVEDCMIRELIRFDGVLQGIDRRKFKQSILGILDRNLMQVPAWVPALNYCGNIGDVLAVDKLPTMIRWFTHEEVKASLVTKFEHYTGARMTLPQSRQLLINAKGRAVELAKHHVEHGVHSPATEKVNLVNVLVNQLRAAERQEAETHNNVTGQHSLATKLTSYGVVSRVGPSAVAATVASSHRLVASAFGVILGDDGSLRHEQQEEQGSIFDRQYPPNTSTSADEMLLEHLRSVLNKPNAGYLSPSQQEGMHAILTTTKNVFLVLPCGQEAAGTSNARRFFTEARRFGFLEAIVFDEAHQVLTSGANYRGAFLQLAELAKLKVRFIFMSGTLPPGLRSFLARMLRLPEDSQVVIQPTQNGMENPRRIFSLLQYPGSFRGQWERSMAPGLWEGLRVNLEHREEGDVRPVLILVPGKATAENLASECRKLLTGDWEESLDFIVIHSEVAREEHRQRLARLFESVPGKVVIVFATSQLADGIDIPELSLVIIVFGLYNGLLSVLQAASRVGRGEGGNGRPPPHAILVFSDGFLEWLVRERQESETEMWNYLDPKEYESLAQRISAGSNKRLKEICKEVKCHTCALSLAWADDPVADVVLCNQCAGCIEDFEYAAMMKEWGRERRNSMQKPESREPTACGFAEVGQSSTTLKGSGDASSHSAPVSPGGDEWDPPRDDFSDVEERESPGANERKFSFVERSASHKRVELAADGLRKELRFSGQEQVPPSLNGLGKTNMRLPDNSSMSAQPAATSTIRSGENLPNPLNRGGALPMRAPATRLPPITSSSTPNPGKNNMSLPYNSSMSARPAAASTNRSGENLPHPLNRGGALPMRAPDPRLPRVTSSSSTNVNTHTGAHPQSGVRATTYPPSRDEERRSRALERKRSVFRDLQAAKTKCLFCENGTHYYNKCPSFQRFLPHRRTSTCWYCHYPGHDPNRIRDLVSNKAGADDDAIAEDSNVKKCAGCVVVGCRMHHNLKACPFCFLPHDGVRKQCCEAFGDYGSTAAKGLYLWMMHGDHSFKDEFLQKVGMTGDVRAINPADLFRWLVYEGEHGVNNMVYLMEFALNKWKSLKSQCGNKISVPRPST